MVSLSTYGLYFLAHARKALEGVTQALAEEIDPEWNIKVNPRHTTPIAMYMHR